MCTKREFGLQRKGGPIERPCVFILGTTAFGYLLTDGRTWRSETVGGEPLDYGVKQSHRHDQLMG